jgi:hypothetical protein
LPTTFQQLKEVLAGSMAGTYTKIEPLPTAHQHTCNTQAKTIQFCSVVYKKTVIKWNIVEKLKI